MEDLYAPRSTGVHNVHLDICASKDKPDKRQQWVWNQEDSSLINVANNGALFEGFNQNVIVYKWKGLHNQRWKYNIGTKRFENKFTGRAMDVFKDVIAVGSNILTNDADLTTGQRWIIDYQSEDHGHDHGHGDEKKDGDGDDHDDE